MIPIEMLNNGFLEAMTTAAKVEKIEPDPQEEIDRIRRAFDELRKSVEVATKLMASALPGVRYKTSESCQKLYASLELLEAGVELCDAALDI